METDPRIIIVTGCARSGTSLVAGILNKCGAFQGETIGATRWNKKGQFENDSIRNTMTKPYLRKIGADPMGQDPLPNGNIPIVEDWRERFLNLVTEQGWNGKDTLLVKEAKACLMWQVWHHAFPMAKWVIVRRDDGKIIDSCMKTSFMRNRKTRASWQEWIEHHKAKFQEMKQAGLNMTEVWPDISFMGGLLLVKLFIGFLGLTWQEKAVQEFIDPNLWHG